MEHALLALALAVSAEASVAERWFSQGWAKADAPVFRVVQAPDPSDAAHQDDNGEKHGQVAHMGITQRAFELYASQFESAGLARYIGGQAGNKPHPAAGTVVAGAYDADTARANPFDNGFPYFGHFWDPRTGREGRGMSGQHSNPRHPYTSMTGGLGLNGQYDPAWRKHGDNGLLHGPCEFVRADIVADLRGPSSKRSGFQVPLRSSWKGIHCPEYVSLVAQGGFRG